MERHGEASDHFFKASVKASVPYYARRAAKMWTNFKHDLRTPKNKRRCWVHQGHDFRMSIAQWEENRF
jgi:hypothetical protein